MLVDDRGDIPLILTSSLNKTGIVLVREKRIREISEELLQESSNTVHVVHEVFGIAEVDL
jgi:rRNA processing protein Gar1